MAEYSPTVTLARLYETTSKNGNTYMRGRMGMANVVLLKTKEVSDSGQPIWSLVVSEAPRRDDYQPRTSKPDHQAPAAEAAPAPANHRGFLEDVRAMTGNESVITCARIFRRKWLRARGDFT